MKIKFKREAFSNGFQIAAALVPLRSPRDVLNNIKVEAADNKVVLMANDQEAGVRLEVRDVEVEKSGKALLNVQRIGNILRECPDETLTIETTANSLDIYGDKSVPGKYSEFHLPLGNPDEFPSVGRFHEEAYFELPAHRFRELVQRTIFATDTDTSRYQLGGVLFEIEGDDITTVATDGRRLAVMQGKGGSVNGYRNSNSSTIVPTKTLAIIERSISDLDENVRICARMSDIFFQTDRCTLYSRLVEGRYPNYRGVIPSKEGRTCINVNVGSFLSAVRQASIVADAESRGIEFSFENHNVIVAAKTAEIGQSRVESEIGYDGPTIHITMDYRFVLDMLKVLPLESNVSLYIKSTTEPALYQTEDNYTYVVMPMSRH